jgi:gas vesicle protein
MKNNKKGHKKNNDENNLSGFLAGLMLFIGLALGSLIGAGVTLLLAPQSGKKTRRQLWRRGRDLREHTADAVDDAVDQVRTKARRVTADIHNQTDALQQRGQDVVDEGKKRWDTVIEAGKAAVNGS